MEEYLNTNFLETVNKFLTTLECELEGMRGSYFQEIIFHFIFSRYVDYLQNRSSAIFASFDSADNRLTPKFAVPSFFWGHIKHVFNVQHKCTT